MSLSSAKRPERDGRRWSSLSANYDGGHHHLPLDFGRLRHLRRRPSSPITDLANLYAWQSYANKSSGSVPEKFYQLTMSCDFPVLGIDLVFHVLSGVSIPGTPPKRESLSTTDHLARVGNGICVYHHAVEDPNLPLETVFRLRFVRGYISYSGFRFKELCGLKGAYVDDGLRLGDLHDESPIRLV